MVAYLNNPLRPPIKDAKSGQWTLSGDSLNWATLDRRPLISYNPIVTHQITELVCNLWGEVEAEAALQDEAVLLLLLPKAAEVLPGDVEAMKQGAEALTRDVEAMIQDAEVTIQDAETLTQDAEAMIQDAEVTIQDAEALIQDAEVTIQDAEALVQDAEALAQDAEALVQDAEALVQDAEALVEDGTETGGHSEYLLSLHSHSCSGKWWSKVCFIFSYSYVSVGV
jgi:Tfp pilus assembly protein PilX